MFASAPRGGFFVAGYLAIYAAALSALHNIEEPLFVLVVVGGGLSLLAWALTRRFVPPPVDAGPAWPVLAYLPFVALFLVFGLGWLPERQPVHDIAAAATKLTVFVAVPAILFRTRVSWRLHPRDIGVIVVLGLVVQAIQLLFSRAPAQIAAAHLGGWKLATLAVMAFAWLSVEAGLVEEYFFRAVLQTRLERATGSAAGGIVLTALLFGLVHAPGIYLRTATTGEALTHPSLLASIAFSIAIISVAAFFFGIVWTRTRNLAIIVLVHGAFDLLPNLLPFAKHFHLA